MIWLLWAEAAAVIAIVWMLLGVTAAAAFHLWLRWARRRR